ncbi:uncharacterized protein N7496_000178 [Penicillium cataractarum]|uniref:VWFA domain-containing protein n=1 Tax=Penicillium cataractarum TaxID=2100454 RepID=A0A9W9VTW3_9EURO|nr:uncharacterized protein N7496_000178 [Penicillium cataractarum]KAJ5389110.1 hypothetical protein N7496_000178 [Penicillium cataractarum]
MRWSTALIPALVGRALATTPGVSPASVSQSQNPGTTFNIQKTVDTPEIPPTPDIVLLVDNTGSMFGAISDIRTNLKTVISSVTSSQPTAEFAVVEFGDAQGGSTVPFRVDQGLASDVTVLQNAVNGLTASGGGDLPEDWINALYQIATGAISFRSGSSRVVVLVSDAPSHNPSGGHTLDDAITALETANIRVIAVNVGGIDTNGQATSVTSATGGSLIPAGNGASGVTDAITSGLHDLPVDITTSISCGAGLSVSFSPADSKVQSGTAATFTETVNVASTAAQGTTIDCSVSFLLNGAPGGDAFIQQVAVSVNDITPPTLSCQHGVNPDGSPNPNTNANFWTLGATDNVSKNLKIYVVDTVSGVKFGPYPSGTNIKLVQAPGATPKAVPGQGAVNWQITVKGCAQLIVSDDAGNNATPVNCCARP